MPAAGEVAGFQGRFHAPKAARPPKVKSFEITSWKGRSSGFAAGGREAFTKATIARSIADYLNATGVS